MTTDSDHLIDRLDAICNLEPEIPCLLTGFYLEDAEIIGIATSLSHENFREGTVGRYRNVPVFRRSVLSEKDRGNVGEYQGVIYSYANLDVAN